MFIWVLSTLMHPINTLLEITHQLILPIFDLGHDLSICCISFQTLIPNWNQQGSCIHMGVGHIDASNQYHAWDYSSTTFAYIWPRSRPFYLLYCFLDSHSWMEPAMILLDCPLIHLWLGILTNLFDLVITFGHSHWFQDSFMNGTS